VPRKIRKPDEEHSLGELLDQKSIELDKTGAGPNPPRDADQTDMPDPKDPAYEKEKGREVDPSDPNLSSALAEDGAQERKNSLGMADEDETRLANPERGEYQADLHDGPELGSAPDLRPARGRGSAPGAVLKTRKPRKAKGRARKSAKEKAVRKPARKKTIRKPKRKRALAKGRKR